MSVRLLFGTTSYVLPDDLLPNVRVLAPVMDDVELVLFEGGTSNLPAPAAVAELRRYGEEGGCGFTVHLPLDVGIGEADAAGRRQAQDVVLRVIDLTLPLHPHAFVVHPEMPLRYHPALGEAPMSLDHLPADELAGWRESLGESLERFSAEVGPHPLAVENLQFPFHWVRPLIDALDLGVAFDIGHLLARGGTVADHLAAFGDRLTVVHLHGIRDGRDHQDVGAYDPAELDEILESIHAVDTRRPIFRGPGDEGESSVVVTLEVFGLDPTLESLRVLSRRFGQDARGSLFGRAAEAVRAAAAAYPAGRLS